MYRVLLHRNAAKAYEKLDEKTATKINKSIDILERNPFYGKNIKRLKGELQGRYRLRAGGYRIVYGVDEGEKAVVIEDIGLRGNVY